MKLFLVLSVVLGFVAAAEIAEIDLESIEILPLEENETPVMDLEKDTPLIDETDEIVSIDANVVAHMTAKDAEALKPESIIDLYDNTESVEPSSI